MSLAITDGLKIGEAVTYNIQQHHLCCYLISTDACISMTDTVIPHDYFIFFLPNYMNREIFL